MKSAGKARSNGLYRHIRTSKEIIRNLLNDFNNTPYFYCSFSGTGSAAGLSQVDGTFSNAPDFALFII